jgi:hypothetical protein
VLVGESTAFIGDDSGTWMTDVVIIPDMQNPDLVPIIDGKAQICVGPGQKVEIDNHLLRLD